MKHNEVIISLSEILWIITPFIFCWLVVYKLCKRSDVDEPAIFFIPLISSIGVTFLINIAMQYTYTFIW